jgi:hypothetical protein
MASKQSGNNFRELRSICGPQGQVCPDAREAESLMPWSTPFDDPIELPDGRKLITLRDAAAYIAELPEEQQAEEWQTAARCLIDTAKGSNLMMHARIVILRALSKRELKRDE